MDSIEYNRLLERPGNDSWLRYRLIMGYDFNDPVMKLDERHSGWAGTFSQSIIVKLDEMSPDKVCLILEIINDWSGGDKGDFNNGLFALDMFLHKHELLPFGLLLWFCRHLAETGNGIIPAAIIPMTLSMDPADILVDIAAQCSDNDDVGETIFNNDYKHLKQIAWTLKDLR